MEKYCFDKALKCLDCLASQCTFAIFSNGASMCTSNKSLLQGVNFKELEEGGERLCPIESKTLPSTIIINAWGPSDYGKHFNCFHLYILNMS
jgi:hypothetical protein